MILKNVQINVNEYLSYKMDDYLNIYEYVGGDHEQQEYSTATNVNKEEHEMVKVTPQEDHQPTQINQRSTNTSETQNQNDIKDVLKATKKYFILITAVMAVVLFISLAAIVLPAVIYNVPDSEKVDLKAQGANTFNTLVQFKKDMELTQMQLNNTLLQLKSEQNMIYLSVTQSEMIATTLLIGQLRDNISQLSIKLDAVNNNITSVATTVENSLSELHIQLEALNTHAISVPPEVRLQCGSEGWHRVAYLNMTDPSQRCPSSWREYNTSQLRACGRLMSNIGSCPAKVYSTNRQYSKVCGRVIGIQVASPDAFECQDINGPYIDGVSITHGSPRKHIWSYVGSVSETTTDHYACPCDYSSAAPPPSFVGNNYYCESGNPNQNWQGQVFPNDKLWDGERCSHEGTCCTGTNTPPWFSVNLLKPTSDDIEVRICGDESTENEDTPIELLEIYVQ